jgi:hypothetical protein
MSHRAPKWGCAVFFGISATWKGYMASLMPFSTSDWREQLAELLERRVEVFERLLPFKRAADAHRHESVTIQATHAASLQMLRQRLQGLLPKAMTADPLMFETLDMLLSLETWQRLRMEQKLPIETSRAIVKKQVALLVD